MNSKYIKNTGNIYIAQEHFLTEKYRSKEQFNGLYKRQIKYE